MFYILAKIFIGGDNMVLLYVALILAKMRKFEQVHPQFKETVKAHLAAIGCDENGDPV